MDRLLRVVLDRDAVKDKFDVWPEQIVDYLALVGDSSDNIPGVPKVGAKTAAKWLNTYDSADGIVANADEITGKVGESLRDNIEQLRLSQDLATIRVDVDLPVAIADLEAGDADIDKLRELYGRFELRTLLKQLDDQPGAPEPEAEAEPEGNYETVLTWEAFDAWLRRIQSADLVAFDTETTSLDYMQAQIVGLLANLGCIARAIGFLGQANDNAMHVGIVLAKPGQGLYKNMLAFPRGDAA